MRSFDTAGSRSKSFLADSKFVWVDPDSLAVAVDHQRQSLLLVLKDRLAARPTERLVNEVTLFDEDPMRVLGRFSFHLSIPCFLTTVQMPSSRPRGPRPPSVGPLLVLPCESFVRASRWRPV